MGHRKLRRVPIDFNWPLHEVWGGYIMDCDAYLCSEEFWGGKLTDREWEMHDKHWEAVHDPPEGKGYQLWETTSEGSPVSPVFRSVEKLAEWCENNATTFGSFKTSKEEWLKMFDDDYIKHVEKRGNTTIIF